MRREVYPSPGGDNHSPRLGHTGSQPERQALLQAHMGGAEAQRGDATCSGLHSQLLVELGFHAGLLTQSFTLIARSSSFNPAASGCGCTTDTLGACGKHCFQGIPDHVSQKAWG